MLSHIVTICMNKAVQSHKLWWYNSSFRYSKYIDTRDGICDKNHSDHSFNSAAWCSRPNKRTLSSSLSQNIDHGPWSLNSMENEWSMDSSSSYPSYHSRRALTRPRSSTLSNGCPNSYIIMYDQSRRRYHPALVSVPWDCDRSTSLCQQS